MSALNITHVHRNLHTRVTFLYLEFEDAFVILGLAVFTNVCGRFLHREVAGVPLNVLLQYIVPILAIPLLIAFKYGKPRRYRVADRHGNAVFAPGAVGLRASPRAAGIPG